MKVIWLLLVGTVFLRADAPVIQVDGVQQEIIVSLPANHDPAKKWPAVFYYHGTGGRPDINLIRSHTGGQDWIVVGMSYVKEGTFQLTPEGLAAEMKVLKEVREQLQQRVNLDPERVYVSGFSKGGWMSGLFLQQDRSLAGGIILGAGHLHEVKGGSRPFAESIPIFIGVGRYDGNYPLALQAMVFFRKLGAATVMETWAELGHRFPQDKSQGLTEWFALESGRGIDEQGLADEFAGILAQADIFGRWWALMEFAERPAVRAAEGLSEKVQTQREALEQDPALAREVKILKESRRLLGKELRKKTLEDFEEIAAGYARIVQHAGDSPQGVTAAKDSERFGEILELAKAQFDQLSREREEVEVKPETERRTRPRSPLVR